jgi:putative ABC transport system permease protein
MPLRNVLRAPRRTALTLLGISAVVAIVVALSGVMDSFNKTLDAARSEALAGSHARLTGDLVAPQPARAATVRSVVNAPGVATAQEALRLPITVRSRSAHFRAFLETVPARTPAWRPTLASGSLDASPGIAIARVAARDLGVHVGDTLAIRHPVPSGNGAFALETSMMRVAAIHSSPFRFLVYGSPGLPRTIGVGGIVNRVSVVPGSGYSAIAVKRALMQLPGVASVQSATASIDAVDKRMAQFTDVLVVTVAIALVMALLMAFNASAINADERSRETATMFAFGLRLPRVLRIAVEEAFIVGLLATAIGGVAGYALLRWLVGSSMPDTMPDVGMVVAVNPLTIVYALIAGTVTVALAPLLTRRRLARTDIPSTLRVME